MENVLYNVIIMYKRSSIMTQIKPITELRNTTEISDICHRRKEPIFITKNGYGDMVVMSIEAYDELIETVQTDRAIQESEAEYNANGVLLDARETMKTLRRKYFG